MRPRQHGAGWSGPERGGEWFHIQLVASHKWFFRAQYLDRFRLLSLSIIWMRNQVHPHFADATKLGRSVNLLKGRKTLQKDLGRPQVSEGLSVLILSILQVHSLVIVSQKASTPSLPTLIIIEEVSSTHKFKTLIRILPRWAQYFGPFNFLANEFGTSMRSYFLFKPTVTLYTVDFWSGSLKVSLSWTIKAKSISSQKVSRKASL